MKWLLAVLFAISANAFADSWAMPNKAGGEIVITTRPCPGYPKLLRAYYYLPDGQMGEGCWTVLDNRVQVIWEGGAKYTYSLDSFYVKEKSKKGTAL